MFGKRLVWLSLSNLGILTHSFLCWNVSICCDYVDWTKRFAFVAEFFSMFIIFFSYLSCIYKLIYLYVGILTCLYVSDFIVQCLLFSVFLIRRFVLLCKQKFNCVSFPWRWRKIYSSKIWIIFLFLFQTLLSLYYYDS